MESILISTIAFIFVIGILVFFHEAGHFTLAKLFKVHVETFSLGFGPRLWGMKKGVTDYRISAIPLGGYVKMLGENPDEMEESQEVEGALVSKPAWQRLLIFVAGPGANIVLAVLIPALVFMVHFETPAYKLEPARVAFIAPGSPADEAGLQPGDLIVGFDGMSRPRWSDVEDITFLKPGRKLPVIVERAGQRVALTLEVGDQVRSGEKVGVSGLVPDLPGDGVEVGRVDEGSPAEKAGLQAGDRITGVEGKPIKNILELQAFVGSNVGRPLSFTILRKGRTTEAIMTPYFDEARGIGRIGFSAPGPYTPPMKITRLGPVDATRMAIGETMRTLWIMKEAFSLVLEGQRSVRDTFAGPLSIAAISGQAAQRGATSLLMIMAMLSLSLGIFNLFPIPILDGGQVLMLFLEKGFGWFGGELSVALRERIQTVGFAVLALLMGYIIYADISKLMP